jgi:hypothetical protein
LLVKAGRPSTEASATSRCTLRDGCIVGGTWSFEEEAAFNSSYIASSGGDDDED